MSISSCPRTGRNRISTRRLSAAAVVVITLLLATACAESDTGSDTNASAPEGGKSTNDAALTYTGGQDGPADDSLSPFVVGYVTQDGGIPGWPESVASAKAATEYINAELGGIDGHPLELRTCLVVSSEEEGQKCGQEMANDSDVRAVVTGNLIVGNASLYQTVGDSKVVLGTPTTPADYAADNNVDLVGAGYTALPGMAIYAATTLKAHNVAMIYADEPGGQAAASLVAKYMDDYGVNLTKVPVNTTSTDVIGAITAANAQSADVFLAVVTAPLCIQVAKAQQQLGLNVPVVTTILCSDQAVAQSLGDLPSWTYGGDLESPFLPDASEQAATYVDNLRQYAGDDANIAGFAPHPFAKLMALTKMANNLGYDQATSEALKEAAHEFTGPMWMAGPTIKCGVIPDMQSICNTYSRLYTYAGDGSWSDATDGKWIDILNPPKA